MNEARTQPRGLLREFRNAAGVVVQAHIVAEESTATTKSFGFTLINDRRDSARGGIRLPRASNGRFPLALLVVGLETGKEVIRMIEGHDSVIAVGIDYPFSGDLDFAGWNAVATVFALRETGFKTVPHILMCLDWIFRHPSVDTTDVTIIAVSFGVFTAIPAAVIDRRVKQLVVVQAGGDLPFVIAANAERLEMPIPGWLAGWLGGTILAPFEPNRYIGSFAPRPLLIVSGESDRLFPGASVQSLYDHAGMPKDWIKHRSRHVMPGEKEVIRELTKIVADRLYRR